MVSSRLPTRAWLRWHPEISFFHPVSCGKGVPLASPRIRCHLQGMLPYPIPPPWPPESCAHTSSSSSFSFYNIPHTHDQCIILLCVQSNVQLVSSGNFLFYQSSTTSLRFIHTDLVYSSRSHENTWLPITLPTPCSQHTAEHGRGTNASPLLGDVGPLSWQGVMSTSGLGALPPFLGSLLFIGQEISYRSNPILVSASQRTQTPNFF